MRSPALLTAWMMAGLVGFMIVSILPAEEPPAKAEGVAVEVARERAKMLHDVYEATLDVMHERYFHGDRAMVPARAMEDVFARMSRRSQVEARWIAVNTKAMSVGHEPQSEFEKQAAKELTAGQEEHELVEDGVYQRAAPIQLGDSCVACHTGFFSAQSKSPRLAGLVIRIPVKE